MKVAKIITVNPKQPQHKLKNLQRGAQSAVKSGAVIIAMALNYSDKKNEELRKGTISKETQKSKELHSSNHPVTDRTKINEEALNKADVRKGDYKKYIDKDGYMNDEGKKICKDKGITNFKGNPDQEISEIDKPCCDNDVFSDSSDIDDLMHADISMPEELENIINMPQEVVDSELMSNIMDVLPEGFEPDSDLLANLQEITDGILDMMG